MEQTTAEPTARHKHEPMEIFEFESCFDDLVPSEGPIVE